MEIGSVVEAMCVCNRVVGCRVEGNSRNERGVSTPFLCNAAQRRLLCRFQQFVY